VTAIGGMQVIASIVLLAGAVVVKALFQGALRQFTQWLWIEYPTFQLGGEHLTTGCCRPVFGELLPLTRGVATVCSRWYTGLPIALHLMVLQFSWVYHGDFMFHCAIYHYVDISKKFTCRLAG